MNNNNQDIMMIEMDEQDRSGSPDHLIKNNNHDNNEGNSGEVKRRFYNSKKMKLILSIGFSLLVLAGMVIALYFSLSKKFKASISLPHVIISPVIIISLDGFRYDYLNRGITPNLEELINDDQTFRANYTIPQFPSKTFPNHLSMATGLYPEYHGIISNHMYDNKLKRYFDVGKPSSIDGIWYSGEPIWESAEKNNLKTACFHWAGCEVNHTNSTHHPPPTFNKIPYTHSINASEILNQVYLWSLLNSTDKPYLTMAYIHEVDDAGHLFGPDSFQVNNAVSFFDTILGKLIINLKSSNLFNTTNLIIVSDHGMAYTPSNQILFLNQLTNDNEFSKSCIISDYTPFLSIFTIEGKKTDIEIFNILNGKSDKLQVYLKKDIPKEFQLSNIKNHRIPDVFGIVELGWTLVDSNYTFNPLTFEEKGNHGFNPNYSEMKSMFVAHGPNIKNTNNLKSFSNVEIYNLISSILNLKNISQNNGTNLLTNNIFKK